VIPLPPPEPNDAGSPSLPGPRALDTSVSSHLALDSIPDRLFSIVVTRRGGFTLASAGPARGASGRGNADPGPEASAATSGPATVAPGRQYVTAKRIDFAASTTDTTFADPVEMMFYLDPNGVTEERTGGKPTPGTVSAQQSVRFLAASKQVLLDGDCAVILLRSEPNLAYQHTLAAPRLTLDLVSDPNATRPIAVRACRFAAGGGPVALRIFKRGAGKLLGWTTLQAAELQYGEDPQEFTAVGPGEIWIYNAQAAHASADPNRFSLDRPCYAHITNFDTLKYSASANRIVAEHRARQLLLDYFPLTDGGWSRQVQVVAGHVEASLLEVVAGRVELGALTASQGIHYTDEKYDFVGSVLFYDRSRDLVTVRGDEVLPCKLNNALVDEIEMNLQTGRIRAPVSTPSILQVQR